MFISYQTVRNTFIALGLVTTAGVGYYTFQETPEAAVTYRNLEVVERQPPSVESEKTILPLDSPVVQKREEPTDGVENDSNANTPLVPDNIPKVDKSKAQSPVQAEATTFKNEPRTPTTSNIPTNEGQLIQAAMRIATRSASGDGKDVLGASSRWKLNLYDDDGNGTWDRGKLDTNRDDIDDEKWNFKHGRWEKDGGATVWNGTKWQSSAISLQDVSPPLPSVSPSEKNSQPKASALATQKTSSPAQIDANLTRYREAMRVATAPAAKGKGKDVLGTKSPWKLNLYDDDNDGRWDRGKLDTNRDDIDDEKWNFKNGRWEKEGGRQIWDGTMWKTP